ncbi:MAG: hypothetical protein M3Q34_01660 [bacterium]|nr:hypothetical protein [bacterium]
METLLQQPKSPEVVESVINQILGGKAVIQFASKGLDTHRYNSGHTANYYLYTLDTKKPDGSIWKTHLTVYSPNKKNESFESLPEMAIDISTGQGEMPLTQNSERLKLVYAEIERQVLGQTKG